LTKLFLYIKLLFKLGIGNVLYIFWYRVTLKSGFRKQWFPIRTFQTNREVFIPSKVKTDFPEKWKKTLIEDADKILTGKIRYYAYHWKQIGNPPDWHLNPFDNSRYPNSTNHWTRLPDFHPETGDIKNIWEASRFDWLITLARAYRISGNNHYLTTINNWVKDWVNKNPLNIGPNWKCGQEASIRVINLMNTSLILNQNTKPTQELTNLIKSHLERISSNFLYSIVQDNNHGTSEAAALFIGGAWLEKNDPINSSKARIYVRKGRKWLENRVCKLIEKDGSFSQHSVNYHRLMLDTLSFCEIWRKKLMYPAFSSNFYSRAKAATNWLFQITDINSGLAPNFGANDGTLLNNLNSVNYRDFRPTIRLANASFFTTFQFFKNIKDESLWWLNQDSNKNNDKTAIKLNEVLPSGYVHLHGLSSWALLRFPYFRFRPSHNDVFHFDLWHNGNNILCDAGSYSYNPPIEESTINLKSVKHHNAVSFDGNEQMLKLSRFLLGKWLKVHAVGNIETQSSGTISWKGSYFDNYKNKHQRKIVVENNIWIIEDTLEGNFKDAIIGFNINTLDCVLEKNKLTSPFGAFVLPEQSESSINETYISEYYFQKRKITRLNIRVSKPGKYKTIFNLN